MGKLSSIRINALGARLKNNFGLYCLAVIMTIMPFVSETVGIFSLIPLLTWEEGKTIKESLVFLQKIDGFDYRPGFVELILLMLLIFIFQYMTSLLKSYLSNLLSQKVIENLRLDLFSDLMSKGYLQLIAQDKGRLIQIFQLEASRVGASMIGLVNLMASGLYVFLLLVLLVNISPFLTIITIPLGLILIGLMFVCNRYVHLSGEECYEMNRRESSVLLEIWNNFSMIICHNAEKILKEKYRKLLNKINRLYVIHHTIYQVSFFTTKLFIFIFVILIIVFNHFHLVGEQLETVEIVTFLLVLSRIQPLISSLAADFSNLVTGSVALEMIEKVKALESYRIEDKGDKPFELTQKIKVEDLCYKYPNSDQTVFDRFSCELPAKGLTVILGSSGVGKSTLIHFLLRLYAPNSGKILIDDKDIKEIKLDEWQKNTAFVSQDSEFFQLSLRENLNLGLQDKLSDQQILKLAEDCQIDTWIKEQKNGMDTMLYSGGKNLSGGQRKRLALLRAMLRNPKVLILDEPTAGLDKEREEQLFKLVQKLSVDKAIIMVTHQESAIGFANHLIRLS